jgi:amino acid transporter
MKVISSTSSCCRDRSVTDGFFQVKARSGAEMDRKLQWWDVIALGVGGMMGAGIFVSTGTAARDHAGPAVVLSYLVAGISALLSAFCYTEFAVEMPVAGGAFSYLQITFGEFAAYMTGANLVMEYLLSNAAVARSFTSYAATAVGVLQPDAWRVEIKSLSPPGEYTHHLDFLAVAVVVALTFCLCFSTKNSSTFNLVMTILHLVFVLFIIVAGFIKGNLKNLTNIAAAVSPAAMEPSISATGFAPFGVRGVFNGAAIVYFSYIGYDAVSTTAEEVKNPAKDMPIGVSGSVILVTILYCFIALALCMLQPYNMIDAGAPFSTAFQQFAGWEWASKLIGAGASLGILTSLLVAMLGQARYLCVLGRARVVPYCFATVSPFTNTPVNATIFLGDYQKKL